MARAKTPKWPRDHKEKHRAAAKKAWARRKETTKARYRASKIRAFSAPSARFRKEA